MGSFDMPPVPTNLFPKFWNGLMDVSLGGGKTPEQAAAMELDTAMEEFGKGAGPNWGTLTLPQCSRGQLPL